MSEHMTDHDRIVALERDVDNLNHWRDTLTEHLDQKFDRIDDKIGNLDRKMEVTVGDLRTHMDTKLDDLRDDMQGTLNQAKQLVPQWVHILVLTLVGLLGVAGGLIARGHP